MIENKELGVKIAENPTEELWENVKRNSETRIKEMENALIIERALLEMCEEKLKSLGHQTIK